MVIETAPGVRQTFEEARSAYKVEIEAWRIAMEALRGAQSELRQSERELDDREAELRFTDIEGANAEARAAALRLACKRDPHYHQVQEAAELQRQDVQRWTDEANEQKERIALAKRVMDFTTAWLRFRTTEEETNGHR